MTLEDRLWASVDRTDGCWLWTRPVNRKGYGYLMRGGRGEGRLLAHRAAWELTYGPIPDGLFVCHSCDNPPCVRPDHLFLGSAHDNNVDMAQKGRQWKQSVTHCPKGHEYTPENTRPNNGGHGRRCRECHRIDNRARKRAAREAKRAAWPGHANATDVRPVTAAPSANSASK